MRNFIVLSVIFIFFGSDACSEGLVMGNPNNALTGEMSLNSQRRLESNRRTQMIQQKYFSKMNCSPENEVSLMCSARFATTLAGINMGNLKLKQVFESQQLFEVTAIAGLDSELSMYLTAKKRLERLQTLYRSKATCKKLKEKKEGETDDERQLKAYKFVKDAYEIIDRVAGKKAEIYDTLALMYLTTKIVAMNDLITISNIKIAQTNTDEDDEEPTQLSVDTAESDETFQERQVIINPLLEKVFSVNEFATSVNEEQQLIYLVQGNFQSFLVSDYNNSDPVEVLKRIVEYAHGAELIAERLAIFNAKQAKKAGEYAIDYQDLINKIPKREKRKIGGHRGRLLAQNLANIAKVMQLDFIGEFCMENDGSIPVACTGKSEAYHSIMTASPASFPKGYYLKAGGAGERLESVINNMLANTHKMLRGDFTLWTKQEEDEQDTKNAAKGDNAKVEYLKQSTEYRNKIKDEINYLRPISGTMVEMSNYVLLDQELAPLNLDDKRYISKMSNVDIMKKLATGDGPLFSHSTDPESSKVIKGCTANCPRHLMKLRKRDERGAVRSIYSGLVENKGAIIDRCRNGAKLADLFAEKEKLKEMKQNIDKVYPEEEREKRYEEKLKNFYRMKGTDPLQDTYVDMSVDEINEMSKQLAPYKDTPHQEIDPSCFGNKMTHEDKLSLTAEYQENKNRLDMGAVQSINGIASINSLLGEDLLAGGDSLCRDATGDNTSFLTCAKIKKECKNKEEIDSCLEVKGRGEVCPSTKVTAMAGAALIALNKIKSLKNEERELKRKLSSKSDWDSGYQHLTEYRGEELKDFKAERKRILEEIAKQRMSAPWIDLPAFDKNFDEKLLTGDESTVPSKEAFDSAREAIVLQLYESRDAMLERHDSINDAKECLNNNQEMCGNYEETLSELAHYGQLPRKAYAVDETTAKQQYGLFAEKVQNLEMKNKGYNDLMKESYCRSTERDKDWEITKDVTKKAAVGGVAIFATVASFGVAGGALATAGVIAESSLIAVSGTNAAIECLSKEASLNKFKKVGKELNSKFQCPSVGNFSEVIGMSPKEGKCLQAATLVGMAAVPMGLRGYRSFVHYYKGVQQHKVIMAQYDMTDPDDLRYVETVIKKGQQANKAWRTYNRSKMSTFQVNSSSVAREATRESKKRAKTESVSFTGRTVAYTVEEIPKELQTFDTAKKIEEQAIGLLAGKTSLSEVDIAALRGKVENLGEIYSSLNETYSDFSTFVMSSKIDDFKITGANEIQTDSGLKLKINGNKVCFFFKDKAIVCSNMSTPAQQTALTGLKNALASNSKDAAGHFGKIIFESVMYEVVAIYNSILAKQGLVRSIYTQLDQDDYQVNVEAIWQNFVKLKRV